MKEIMWISYKNKKDALREASELRRKRGLNKTRIRVEERKGGEALNKYRREKDSRYVKVDKRYVVVEYV